jgi:MurNAc alpha-1-phosphate uridylyltransferase
MKQAMVFAAGLGTRLKPLTDRMPKALVEVGGEPLIKRVLFKLRDAGFTRIVVNVHHFANQIVDYLAANHNFGLDIAISDESAELLETGGGIKHAQRLFTEKDPILIHNVDILSNVDLDQFYHHHLSSAPYAPDGTAGRVGATLLVSQRKTKRYLVFDAYMRLVGWTNVETHEVKTPFDWVRRALADPSQAQQPLRLLAFSGIHVFSPDLFPLMESYPERFPIMDFYLQQCGNVIIQGYEKTDLRLMDVGKLDTLHDAETFVRQL